MHTIWYALFYGTHFEYGTNVFIRSEFCRSKKPEKKPEKPEKQQIELHKRYLFPYLQAFLEAMFMSSAWALSPPEV